MSIINADARSIPLADESVQCVVTSPPYFGLRDYGTVTWEGGDAGCDHIQSLNLKRDCSGGVGGGRDKGTRGQQPHSSSSAIPYRSVCGKCGARRIDRQIGLEQTPDEYVAQIVAVFREVWRVLRRDGCVWLNLGDSYASQGVTDSGAHKGLTRAMERYDGSPRNPENHSRMNGTLKPIARNLGGFKPKDLIGIPWTVAKALQADGAADAKAVAMIERMRAALLDEYEHWDDVPSRIRREIAALDSDYAQAKGESWWLRQDVIWHKPNPMPESVTDRCTKSHEYIFLLTKSERYYYNAEAIAEPVSPAQYEHNKRYAKEYAIHTARASTTGQPGNTNNIGIHARAAKEQRNRRSVWTITTQPYADAHFATFPEELPRTCILASSRPGDVVLDPFAGSGTTVKVATQLGRQGVGLELSREYIRLAHKRTTTTIGMGLEFAEVVA